MKILFLKFDESHALVLGVAILERLPKAKSYLHRVLQDKDLKDAPVLIMANKQDVEGALTSEQIYEKLEIE